MPILTSAAMERLLKHAGAVRVSEDAKIFLRTQLEKLAQEHGKAAVSRALNAGRKTVKAEDFKL
ncbi:MAG: histone [Nanoarchaeota archaeon]